MLRWLGLITFSAALGACGAALTTEQRHKPYSVVTGDLELVKYATDFRKDCLTYLSAQKCRLPHEINMQYFPQEQEPDKRGYAELFGYGNTVYKADVRISDYLKRPAFSNSLLTTVYHELFHAWFSLEHDDSSLSIMNSVGYFWDDNKIAKDFQYYVKKEFDRVRNK